MFCFELCVDLVYPSFKRGINFFACQRNLKKRENGRKNEIEWDMVKISYDFG